MTDLLKSNGVAPALLSIGDVANATGLAVSAVRYYDDIEIVTAAARVGGKRRFSTDAIGRLNFVQRAQEAGFSLEEIKTILDDTAGGWRDLVDAKLAELDARRDRLGEMIDLLHDVRRCGCEVVATCTRQQSCC